MQKENISPILVAALKQLFAVVLKFWHHHFNFAWDWVKTNKALNETPKRVSGIYLYGKKKIKELKTNKTKSSCVCVRDHVPANVSTAMRKAGTTQHSIASHNIAQHSTHSASQLKCWWSATNQLSKPPTNYSRMIDRRFWTVQSLRIWLGAL